MSEEGSSLTTTVEAPSNLEDCSKEELLAQIKSLKAHNTQLRNIIAKGNGTSKPAYNKSKQRAFDFSKCSFRHVLLKFFYLGWDHNGYVTQEDTTNTIENYLFDALLKTCLIESREKSNYHRCGRTDKGVSSFGQVISIDLRETEDFCKLLNKVLPDSIQCVAWCPVQNNFSARFDCKSRTYKYYFPHAGLDIGEMKTAAWYLLGEHDFRNFCKMDVGNGVVEFVRNIWEINIEPAAENNCDIYVLTIKGKAFLWHQIRCILGVLFLIGQGKERPELVLELLDVNKNPRKPDYEMASEIPLDLHCCHYDNVKWNYDQEALELAMKKLRDTWTLSAVKTAMMKNMLDELEERRQDKSVVPTPSDCFLGKVRARNYTPVMKRQLCGSLEDRIEHYTKRSKFRAN